MKRSIIKILTGAALLTASGGALAQSDTPPTEVDGTDIIVTANKRDERERDVAGAIKAFSGDQLLAQNLTSLQDYATLTPGLTINAATGSGAPVIRGISTGVDVGSLTGIVVNGAQIGSSISISTAASDALDLDPIDLERVEVLKGPQGTLYGANTLSGLISYILRAPDLHRVTAVARGTLEGAQSGGTSWAVRGAVSMPLVEDKLAVRLSAFDDDKAGFVNNSIRAKVNQNRSEKWGFNGSLLAQPTDRLRVLLSGFYQNIDAARDTVIYNGITHKPQDGDLTYNDYLYPKYRNKIKAAIATIDFDVGFANLTSITAYQDTRSYNSLNASRGAIAQILPALVFFGGPAIPTPSATNIFSQISVKKFTQEARLTSSGDGPFQWIVGGYYAHEDSTVLTGINQTTIAGENLPGLSPILLFDQPVGYREYAGFGNLTYRFSSAFDVTGGLRIGRLHQTYQQDFIGSGTAAYNILLGGFGFPPTPISTPTSTANKTVVTYLATARYHFSSDGMVFARFATGFRPGGPNIVALGLPTTYKPDTTKNYEVGVKSRLFGNKVSIDITGYYTDWDDIIVTVGAGGLSGFGNGGKARVYGVESLLTIRPITGLNLTGSLAYSNAKITDVAASGVGAVGVGDRLPNNPRWSGSIQADYRFPAGASWKGVVGGSARFVGKRHSALASNLVFPDYVLPSYTTFDARAGVESARFDVGLFVRNITNERSQLGAFTLYGINEVTVQRPRTFGATVTARY